jgi:hypothetical protein
MSSITEIKKILYKEKPMATLLFIRKGIAHYSTPLSNGSTVMFEVPVSDMGTADFTSVMDAKLLNRWIVEVDENFGN